MSKVTPTIITLFGPRNSGKTRTVYEAIDHLVARHGVEAARVPLTPVMWLSLMMELEYARVGFIPYGEPRSGFAAQLLDLAKRQCQIIVCAARPRPANTNAVEAVVSGHGYRQLQMTPILEVPSPRLWQQPKPAYEQLIATGAETLAQLVEKVHAGVL